MSEVWINDVDLADYGFVLGANPNHQATPSFADPSMSLLGALGSAWSGEATQSSTRRVAISGNMRAASSSALFAAIDTVKQLCGQGAIRIRLADHSDREFRDGRLVDFVAPPRAAIFTNISADLSIGFECVDPLAYDVNPQGIPVTTVRAALPVGTGPSSPLIILNGGGSTLTNPTLTYRNAAGDSKQTMGFTVSLGANDYLVIDCTRCQITQYTAGVASDGTATWTSGDFLVFRAADGYVESAEYPTLEASATGGSPAGIAMYARAWI